MSLLYDLDRTTNVYRTKYFIVKQVIVINCNNDEIDSNIYSQDTFIKRTKARDREYEKTFGNRLNIDGRRMPTSMSSRKYTY